MALPVDALVENHASPAIVEAPTPTASLGSRTAVDTTLLAEVHG